MKVKLEKIILFIYLICCFTYSFGDINGILPIYFVDACYCTMFLIIIFYSRKISVTNTFVGLIIFVLLTSYISNINNVDVRTVKSSIKFIIFSFTTFYLLNSHKDNRNIILNKYVNFCVLIGVIGYLQVFSFILKFQPLYNFNYLGTSEPAITNFIRIASIATEPAWMIQIILPAIYLSVGTLFFKDDFSISFMSIRKAIFFIVLGLISQSSLFIIIVPIFYIFFLVRLNFMKSLKLIAVGIVIFSVLIPIIYTKSHDFKYRIDSFFDLSVDEKKSDNLSIFALLSNMYVTKEALKNAPLLGSGIDSHRLSYDRYIYDLYNTKDVRVELNASDAGSFFFRLPSEFGIVGFLLLSFLLLGRYRDARINNDHFFFLYFSCFIAFSLRNGQYLNPFFQLYLWGMFVKHNFDYVEGFDSNRDFTSSSNRAI